MPEVPRSHRVFRTNLIYEQEDKKTLLLLASFTIVYGTYCNLSRTKLK